MPGYSLGHLQNHVVIQGLVALLKNDRATTAQLLAHIGEIDARRIYADEGFTSMFDYCVRVHHFTEDMAGMRIRAARTARRFPVVFGAIAEGRLTVTAMCLVSKHLKRLTREAALELLAASEHKTKDAIRLLLAERFPQPDVQARVTTLPRQNVGMRVVAHVPERVEVRDSSSNANGGRRGREGSGSVDHGPAARAASGPHDAALPRSIRAATHDVGGDV